MRLRNVKNAFARIDGYDKVLKEPQQYKGKWCEFFGNNHKIQIEIGMGKGQFLIEQAKRYPDINFIGFEKYTVVIVKALEKISQEEALKNLVVLRFDAEQILDIFKENEVDRIYLNFSDPWPKDRHYKRRLTYRDFLNKYRIILREEGILRFKSDNNDLFEFSLEEIHEVKMKVLKETRDLHGSEWILNNIMTEYESKFTSEGIKINMVEVGF